ncbi:MAG: hypothetical protein SGILL_010209, partial [Bacillariaceae sp.]
WFCGSITLYHEDSGEMFLDGRELDVHGAAITPTTYGDKNKVLKVDDKWRRAVGHVGGVGDLQSRRFRMESDAKCIVVIEKEGAYTRLSEDRIFDQLPCILVTGKGTRANPAMVVSRSARCSSQHFVVLFSVFAGFPDVATRQWVHHLRHLLDIPVVGLCDCNPYGVSVLSTYQYQHGVQVERAKQQKDAREALNGGVDQTESTFQLQWIGLQPSQIESLDLPRSVFQELSTLDKKRLKSLLQEDHPFLRPCRGELLAMKRYKVELEALHWMGMTYMSRFVLSSLREVTKKHEESTSSS